MDFEVWKAIHKNDTGGQLLMLLIQEATEKAITRRVALEHRYNPVAYWCHKDSMHQQKMDWLIWKLTGILERKEGTADADGEGPVPGELEADRAGG